MILELDRPALLELAERSGYRNPLAAYHRAQLLVGVVGGDAVAVAADYPLRVDQGQDLGCEPRRDFFTDDVGVAALRVAQPLSELSHQPQAHLRLLHDQL